MTPTIGRSPQALLIVSLTRLAKALALAAFAGALAACQPKPAAVNKVVLIDHPVFTKNWETQLVLRPGETVQSIYLVANQLHILTNQNYDHVVTASSGGIESLNQIGSTDFPLVGGPTPVNDGIAYANGENLEIYGRDGRFRREIGLGYLITSPPTGSGNYVFVGLDQAGGRFSEVDITKMIDPTVWQVMTYGAVRGAAAVFNDGVYFGSEDGSVRACSLDRSLYWPLLADSRFTTHGAILADVKADASGVYFASTDGILYCLDRNSGRVKWRYFAGPALNTSPSITLNMVYQYVPGTGLAALQKEHRVELDVDEADQSTESAFRSPIWIAPNAVRYLSEDDQYVYVLSDKRSVLALDKQSGKPMFETREKGLMAFTGNPKNSMIYAVTSGGRVVAILPVTTPGGYGELAMRQASPVATGATLLAQAR